MEKDAFYWPVLDVLAHTFLRDHKHILVRGKTIHIKYNIYGHVNH